MKDPKTVDRLTITILVDMNSQIGEEYRANGVSFFIEVGQGENEHRMLFDTSYDGDALFRNAGRLKKDLSTIDSIFLSHGHFDHTNGLTSVLKNTRPKPELFCHRNIFLRKILAKGTENEMDIGITANNDISYIRERTSIRYIAGKTALLPGVWGLSGIPRIIETQPISGKLTMVERENPDRSFIVDPVDEDSSLIVELSGNRLFLVTGCGHSGIQNTIAHVREAFPGKTLIGIIGGTQLHDKSDEDISNVFRNIGELDLEYFCPIHSTGENAMLVFSERMGDEFVEGGVGTVMDVR